MEVNPHKHEWVPVHFHGVEAATISVVWCSLCGTARFVTTILTAKHVVQHITEYEIGSRIPVQYTKETEHE